MRGVDEDSGDYLGPSRGELRREALSVLELAHRLVEQPAARLLQLPMSEDLVALAIAAQRITAQIARKRQVGFLAKKLRREDDETLEALRAAMEHDKADSRRDTAALHRVEAVRDRLIAEGDSALAELLDEYPDADRQHLRQLARNAREEKLRKKPPHAFRDLFRELRELMQDKPEQP
ncbi:MAG: ribosome biogenesis factor YjgA [Arenimonas sp.]